MFRIAVRDVLLSAVAAGLAIGWWLNRQAKQADRGQPTKSVGGRLDSHPSFAGLGSRRDYERFSKFRLN
jgi:hypothetical protein